MDYFLVWDVGWDNLLNNLLGEGGKICPPLCTIRAGGKILTVNSKHLASWISGISIRYFKGTHTIQLPCMYYTLSLLQTKLAEKNTFLKKINILSYRDSNKHFWKWKTQLKLKFYEMKKGQRSRKKIMIYKNVCFEKSRSTIVSYIIKIFVHFICLLWLTKWLN